MQQHDNPWVMSKNYHFLAQNKLQAHIPLHICGARAVHGISCRALQQAHILVYGCTVDAFQYEFDLETQSRFGLVRCLEP